MDQSNTSSEQASAQRTVVTEYATKPAEDSQDFSYLMKHFKLLLTSACVGLLLTQIYIDKFQTKEVTE